ncbi:UNVERIFIED_CONTAM: hypothetical protein GTU68_005724 [Idotea baltica]|nr:hypothetical protein [Idotea baltica]
MPFSNLQPNEFQKKFSLEKKVSLENLYFL